jgi:hypothetical protein
MLLALVGCDRSAHVAHTVTLTQSVTGLPVAPVKVEGLERYVGPGMVSLIVQTDPWTFTYMKIQDAQTLTYQTGNIGYANPALASKMIQAGLQVSPEWTPRTRYATAATGLDLRSLLDDTRVIAGDHHLGRPCHPADGYELRSHGAIVQPPAVYVIWSHHRSAPLGCDKRGQAVSRDAGRLRAELRLNPYMDIITPASP